MLCFLFTVAFLAVADGYNLANCPPNIPQNEYTRVHGNLCYEFVMHRTRTWHDAEDDCSSKGGNLVTIRNPAEQHFLMSVLGSLNFQGEGVWIGLSDEQTEGYYNWASGDPVSYTYWGSGQPGLLPFERRRFILDDINFGLTSLGPNEDCVLLKYKDSGHWHDYPCSNILIITENFPYICEFPMVMFNSTTASTNTSVI